MQLRRLLVRDFRCVASADVDLAPGLNVLHGPNDLGKSTLATALRAGLLLLHGSSEAKKYIPWGTDRKPRVQVEFEVDGRSWRVSKTFASGSGGGSLLEWSNDGEHFTKAEEGRAVDGEVRRLLAWGIAAPGGKKRQSGLPRSFLSSVLLGEQALPYRLFEETLEKDDDDSGRQRLTEALQALATDPLYQRVLDEAQSRVDAAFDSRGKPRSGKGSPFRGVTDEIKRRHAASEELDRQVTNADVVEARLAELATERDQWTAKRGRADEALAVARRDFELGERRAELAKRVAAAQSVLDEIERNREEMRRLTDAVREHESALPAAKEALSAATEERKTAEEELARARQKLEAAREGGEAEARATRAALLQKKAELEGRVAKRQRFDRAKEAVAREEAAAAEAGQQRAQAEALEKEAQVLTAAVEERALPDVERRAQLRTIRDEMRLLRAKLGGGVSVQLRLAKSRKVDAKIDGAEAETFDPGASLEAQSEVVLDLGRAGSIEIVAGEAGARREATEAQARYADVVEPVLERCGVKDVEALDALAALVDKDVAKVSSLRQEAATLRRLAEAHDPDALAAARAELAKADADWQAGAAAVGGGRAGSPDDAERRDPGGTVDADAAGSGVAVLRGELAAVDEAIRKAEAGASGVVEAAAKAEAKVVQRRAKAEAAEQQARAEVERRSRGAAEAKAALDVRKEQARTHNPMEAAEAFAKANDELQSLPEPERVIGADELAAAERAVQEANQRLDDSDREVRKQEGALQQVGGQVIREKADAAREALEAARRKQAEVELDYAGWRLLRDTLREAENEEGQHLGRALGKEVGERFEALTRGRYGALQLGPDLQARGLQTDTGQQEITALSEGLKEQLATILRVSIAQHLHGVLVLDDHLAQTDPARASWFQELLLDAAKTIQIVVLTCRPGDYIHGDDAGLHGIDLTGVITRVE